jgi:hypothetical protein
MGTMECMHGSVPGMLLSNSFEPYLSHTSIPYAVTIAYITMQTFNENILINK